jgi:NAD(P)-dependent dehydrogenase (short-subunit alcohol dehydrogenase family)
MDKEFENKVVIVTGGASGVGKATAEMFNINGAKVIIIDKNDCETDCDYFYKGDLTEKEVIKDFKVVRLAGNVDYDLAVTPGYIKMASNGYLTTSRITVKIRKKEIGVNGNA